MNAQRPQADRVDFELTVVTTRPPRRCDVRVCAPRGTPVAAVAVALRQRVGLPADATAALHVGTVPVDLTAPIEDALRPGSLVLLGAGPQPDLETGRMAAGSRQPARTPESAPAPIPTLDQPAPPQLHVIGGPDAGGTATLPSGSTVIGRGAAAGLRVVDSRVSRRHAVARVTAGAVDVADFGSTNGTFVDGLPVAVSGQRLRVGELLRVGDTTLTLAPGPGAEPVAAVTPTGDGHLALTRPPRLRGPAPAFSVVLPTRPTESPRPKFAVLAVLAPLVLGLVMWRLFGQLYFLLFTLLTPVLAIGTAVSDRASAGRAHRRSMAAYEQTRAEAELRLVDEVCADAQAQRRAAPDLAMVASRAQGPLARLWERRRSDADVLELRIGTADGPSRVMLATDSGVVLEPPRAPMVPVTVRLPDIGVLGIAGSPRQAGALARTMLAQAATLHAPGDLAVVILATSDRAAAWEWARWLPHIRSGPALAGCRAHIGLGEQQAAARTAELAAWVADAEAPHPTGRAGHRANALLIIDGARRLRSNIPGLAALLDAGASAGIFAICLDDDERLLPQECAVVVRFLDRTSTRVSVCPADSSGVENVIADTASAEWAERMARALAPLRLDASNGTGAASLPDLVRWTDIVALPLRGDGGDVAALITRWGNAAGSITVALGWGRGGLVTADLAADGPHTLVAGTTGSGKSELLRTLVAGLVADNRPDRLSLLLIDYKGGAAFGPCVALPHTVGVVTDLDAAETQRALTSLHAELRRRELVLHAAGVADFDAYRRAMPQPSPAPLPRLVIIVDEFAALSKELPDFVDGLVGVAQRGRSLGVHLVLATQRPEGVVRAEIRANTNLRICLAVTRAAESLDVLDTPVAASIPRTLPGRAFVRAGPDAPTAFQTARVSTGSASVGEPPAPVVVPAPYAELGASASAEPEPGPTPSGDSQDSDLDKLVRAVAGATEHLGVAPAPPPWLPPLPAVVEVAALSAADPPPARPGGVPAAPYGLQDLPAKQRRRCLTYDPATVGHLLITGTAGSGRTTTVRTLAGSLAASTGPDDVHLYAVDAGGGGLAPLEGLPHCGAVVPSVDSDRLDRLLSVLRDEVHRRQRMFAAAGHRDVAEQRAAATAGDRLPYLILVVHQWDALLAAYQDADGGRVPDSLLRLFGDGLAVGLRAIVTGDRATLLGRLASVMTDRLLLRLADPADYSLVGLRPVTLPHRLPRGRGWSLEGLVSTQVAVLGADPAGAAQSAALRRIAVDRRRDCSAIPTDRLPRRVDAMPNRVSLAELARREAEMTLAGGAVVPLGIGGDQLQVITVDLRDGGSRLLIGGGPGSGRSTALGTIAAGLLRADYRLLVVAPRPSPLRALAGWAEVVGVVEDRADDTQLAGLLRAMPRPLAVLVDDADCLIDAPLAVELDRLATLDGPQRPVVVAAGSTEALATTYRPWVVDARRGRAGLLLGARSVLDGELVGLRLPRTSETVRRPPGRGILVIHGQAIPLQVATSDVQV